MDSRRLGYLDLVGRCIGGWGGGVRNV